MKITSVEFLKSVADIADMPKDNLDEIAFAGRSNVGKSSLINCLLNRKKLAKTSSTPGKTRLLNYFRINDAFYFVDLPGYGFAKVSRQEKERWKSLIETFMQKSPNLKGVVSIIDSRIGATKLDIQLLEWIKSLDQPVVVVATKADKLSKSAMMQRTKTLSKELTPFALRDVIPFSSVNGTGKKELLGAIHNLVEK